MHPVFNGNGWEFSKDFPATTGDCLYGLDFVHRLYALADPEFTGRVTVPPLWDQQSQTIVSTESADIARMFNSAFDALTGSNTNFYPKPLRREIDLMNRCVQLDVNAGVYRVWRASTQEAYATEVSRLFTALDWLDIMLSSRRYLCGE